jgi:hypothetical protein
MTIEEPGCHHVYTGGADGGVKGVRCKHLESEHADMAHPFLRAPVEGLFRVEWGARTFGVVVVNGIVTADSAPTVKKFVGQTWAACSMWLKRKGATIWKQQKLF